MRARAVRAGVGALLLLTSCGDSSGKPASGDKRLLSVLSATQAAESFRYETVTREVTSGATHQTSSRTTEGAIDYGHETSVQTRSSTDSEQPPFEFRSIAGVGYQRISDELVDFYGAPKGTRWIRTEADRIAAAGGCVHYFVGSTVNPLLGGTFVGLPDPERALDSLRSTSATLERDGTENVRGTPTTHWRIDATSATTTTIPPSCSPVASGIQQSAPRVEIWTDAQNRLRRIVTTNTMTVRNLLGQSFDQLPNSGPSTVEETRTTEFFDFGAAVRVDPPPAGEVFDASDVVGAMLAGPGTVAKDAWQNVAHGTFNGADWNVWYARSDTRWRCYSAEGVPPPEGGLVDPPNAASYPKHDGHDASCLPSSGSRFGNGRSASSSRESTATNGC